MFLQQRDESTDQFEWFKFLIAYHDQAHFEALLHLFIYFYGTSSAQLQLLKEIFLILE
jgi:hypothetical protein